MVASRQSSISMWVAFLRISPCVPDSRRVWILIFLTAPPKIRPDLVGCPVPSSPPRPGAASPERGMVDILTWHTWLIVFERADTGSLVPAWGNQDKLAPTTVKGKRAKGWCFACAGVERTCFFTYIHTYFLYYIYIYDIHVFLLRKTPMFSMKSSHHDLHWRPALSPGTTERRGSHFCGTMVPIGWLIPR